MRKRKRKERPKDLIYFKRGEANTADSNLERRRIAQYKFKLTDYLWKPEPPPLILTIS